MTKKPQNTRRMQKITNLDDIESGSWVTIEAKVEQLWESDHAAIRQIGILTDDTGIIKFVSWEKSELPLLEEGVIYRFTKCPISEYDHRLQLALVKTTRIERLSPPASIQAEIPVV